jgi:hypothetical protein
MSRRPVRGHIDKPAVPAYHRIRRFFLFGGSGSGFR